MINELYFLKCHYHLLVAVIWMPILIDDPSYRRSSSNSHLAVTVTNWKLVGIVFLFYLV